MSIVPQPLPPKPKTNKEKTDWWLLEVGSSVSRQWVKSVKRVKRYKLPGIRQGLGM